MTKGGQSSYDAVVVGSGPNGLAAAVTLAEAGLSVLVVEGKGTPGGGVRSADVTLSGFVHDLCSAVHPLGSISPFFRSLPLADHGLEWVQPRYPLAHPLDGGRAVVQDRSITETMERLGSDGQKWWSLIGGTVQNSDLLFNDLLGPLPWRSKRPFTLARFGWYGMQPASWLAKRHFKTEEARALFAGHAAHSIQPLQNFGTGAFGMMLATSAHVAGWPVAMGGSQKIADALVSYLESLGGALQCKLSVKGFNQLPRAKAYLFDTSPRAMVRICGLRLPPGYVRRLNSFRYGPGVFKIDLALKQAIPWQNPECCEAGTVHVGGTLEEISASEKACWRGQHIERPFVLVAQQSVCDPTRAPEGMHTCWAYCHVPHGSDMDMTDAILNQIERFAPGFRDTIIATFKASASDLETYNPNYVGGDIVGGVQDLTQLFSRPIARMDKISFYVPRRPPRDPVSTGCAATTQQNQC